MQLDISEATVPTLENLLVPNKVSYEGIEYTTYTENEVKASDRCLGLSNGSDMSLFQITDIEDRDESKARKALASLDFSNEDLIKKFIGVGVNLINDTKNGVKEIVELQRNIEVDGKKFGITYMSNSVNVVGSSLHDNYQKRVMNRIYS